MKTMAVLFLPLLIFLTAAHVKEITDSEESWELYEPSQDQQPNAFNHYYVHIVPHTHDDVGWLKTPDSYFSGTLMNVYQYAGVEIIIDSIIDELLLDPQRKFSYVEMKFFTMWWDLQTDEMKDKVRALVSEGRLEMLNAGWSMHDEACPHYDDMIFNMKVGHDFVQKEFGVAPRIGWQIDPFGHSNTNARLFAEMGFDAMFFARLDYQDKNRRLDDSEMEFVWRPSFSTLGDEAQILTHAFYQFYFSPSGFNFDIAQEDDPFVDDKDLDTYNADKLTQTLYNLIMSQKNHYRTNQLLIVMGGDFCFMNAKMYFQSLDKLIAYFNSQQSDVTLLYSTPSQFVDALAATGTQWPTKYDDFFPYADGDVSMWTGYFTSRANDKEYIRRASHNLASSSHLFAQKFLEQGVDDALLDQLSSSNHAMFDAVGVNQHHDAATGTGKQHVANDYARSIFEAMQLNNQNYAALVGEVAEALAAISSDNWQWCFKENSTYLDCPIADHSEENFFIAVHHPSEAALPYAKFSAPHAHYEVMEFNYQSGQFESVRADGLCDNMVQNDQEVIYNCDIYVELMEQDRSFAFLSVIYNQDISVKAQQQVLQSGEPLQIESDSEILSYLYSMDEREVFELTKKDYAQTLKFSFGIRFWPSFGSNSEQSSGVYIFRPQDDVYTSNRYVNLIGVLSQVGQFASEIHLMYKNNGNGAEAGVLIRLFQKTKYSEWVVNLNGIPDVGLGMEVTVNFKSLDIDNQDTFYTDSNGLEMQKRILNYRPTWDWSGSQVISGNYYPIQTAIAIKDPVQKLQMTVMNSRSQGGSSLNPGEIELMQNRRMFFDDWRGMGEALDEKDENGLPIAVSATYFLQLFNYIQEPSLQRQIQLIQDQPPLYFYSFDAVSASNNVQKGTTKKDKLQQNSAQDVLKVVVLPVEKNKVQIRVENLGDLLDSDNAQADRANPLQIDINQIALDLFISANGDDSQLLSIAIVEKSLTGNMDIGEMKARKIQWLTEDDALTPKIGFLPDANEEIITLEKQRIRVFDAHYQLQ